MHYPRASVRLTRLALSIVTAMTAMTIPLVPAMAAQNMIGRQSQNEGILVVPAPANVKIDGDLSEWDLSGRISIFADTLVRDRFSVEAAAMWDENYLYFAAKWQDPTPMQNAYDPAFNPGEGWKADAMQLRVRSADMTSWITTRYYTPKRQSVLDIEQWKNMNDSRAGSVGKLFVGKEDSAELGDGVQLAYKPNADGKGFVQEMRIPWTLIHTKPPVVKVGMPLRIGMEFIWGTPSGRGWPVHRYADNMQPGKTSREFYWTAVDSWGDATLVDKGNVALRQYEQDVDRIPGTIPVAAKIPASAKYFTLVLEDAQGKRIRTIAADCDPQTYSKSVQGDERTVEVMWDGLNDFGKPVTPGNYALRGLTRGSLGAEYDMCFYNPGTPPWTVKGGVGAWGADHHAPRSVACYDTTTVIAWPFAEGGSGIIALGAEGKKIWSQYRGADAVALDAENVYAFQSLGWYSAGMSADFLCRYSIKTGIEKPFVLDGKNRVFDLSLWELLAAFIGPKPAAAPTNPALAFQEKHDSFVNGMAVHGKTLVLALAINKIAVLDAETAKPITVFDAANPTSLAFTSSGQLYALLNGQVNIIDVKTGAATPVPTPGIGKAGSMSLDHDGNILITDLGPDCQVKAFTPAGKPLYTCGKTGGRPIRGAFNEQAMTHMTSVAGDDRGRVWVVEGWDFPRRVSVWGRDGKLVRDYVGNTGYSGVGAYLHEQDPDRAFVGPVELKIDHATRTWKVVNVLWVPDPLKGERFIVGPGGNSGPIRFRRTIAGQTHEYFYHHDESGPHVVFMEFADGWRPVAAICLIGQMLELQDYHNVPSAMPTGEWAGLDPADGCYWNDANGDGIPQRSECIIVPATTKSVVGKGEKPALDLRNGWGGRVGPDLSIYVANDKGIICYKPASYTSAGAPIYNPSSNQLINTKMPGAETVPTPDGKNLLCIAGSHGGSNLFTSVRLSDGEMLWTYPNPFPGVHGSHNATMPKPGLLIGPLKICGIADMGKEIGSVVLIRGNLGQDFLFTTDGLYIGTLFQDVRLPGDPLPDTEEKLIGQPLETYSEGSEPFNGWFGKQSDGKVRQTCGIPGQAAMIMEIKGLETIRRFTAGPFTVDQAAITLAMTDNDARARTASVAAKATIARFTPTNIDGELNEWSKVPVIAVGREGQPEKAAARLAYDDNNLYIAFDVTDASPWKNQGKDYSRLFKTGDCVDVQLSTLVNEKTGDQPAAGDKRILISQLDGKPVVVLMAPIDKSASAEMRKLYTSPVGPKTFDRLEVLKDVKLAVKTRDGGYRVEAAIPLATLGMKPTSGMTIRGDVGIITSDAQGTINTARIYWSNKSTNLVSDLPIEAWFRPSAWGVLQFE